MALFSYETRSQRTDFARSLFTPLLRVTDALLGAWRQYQTLRTIESLPYEARKDVGFPGVERMNDR